MDDVSVTIHRATDKRHSGVRLTMGKVKKPKGNIVANQPLGHSRPSRNSVACAVLLSALTFLVYTPAINCKFIWDDDDYVENNPTLRSLVGLKTLWIQPRSLPQYYPLVHSTYWLEYQLTGLNPRTFHLTNIVLHYS